MQFTINNQTINISANRTDITIHHPVECGGDKHESFPFSILEWQNIVEMKGRHYPTYWWLGTLHNQIISMTTCGKQLELFN